ncbi:hypothetical protein [Sphaerotilus sp.]|uniref:hypothetical protein n=1 Tax=Sphaerotilus sp. TaxID=2093942 RepID=UPI002ACD92C1|nr:hypothetical protein [Sphaerotilus sp.]MDZ7855958.1 hypothetical protein [Sphaerotilus sp.]
MAKTASALKKPDETPRLATKASAGRVFAISLKGIPRVDAQAKARLEAASRTPSSKRRDYPQLAVE